MHQLLTMLTPGALVAMTTAAVVGSGADAAVLAARSTAGRPLPGWRQRSADLWAFTAQHPRRNVSFKTTLILSLKVKTWYVLWLIIRFV